MVNLSEIACKKALEIVLTPYFENKSVKNTIIETIFNLENKEKVINAILLEDDDLYYLKPQKDRLFVSLKIAERHTNSMFHRVLLSDLLRNENDYKLERTLEKIERDIIIEELKEILVKDIKEKNICYEIARHIYFVRDPGIDEGKVSKAIIDSLKSKTKMYELPVTNESYNLENLKEVAKNITEDSFLQLLIVDLLLDENDDYFRNLIS